MVGNVTVTSPANKLLIPVTQTTVTSTIAVVPLPGASCGSAETAFGGGLIGLVSSVSGGVSSPFNFNLGGCVTLAGVCEYSTSSIDVEERDMAAQSKWILDGTDNVVERSNERFSCAE